jgi:hypothetical protein
MIHVVVMKCLDDTIYHFSRSTIINTYSAFMKDVEFDTQKLRSHSQRFCVPTSQP